MNGTYNEVSYAHHGNLDDGEIPRWTEGRHRITLQPFGSADTMEVVVTAESHDTAPAIEISLDVARELLSDDAQAAIVNAVSLSTMPVVRWA